MRLVMLGGIAAGTLDLVYICTFWALRGVGPIRIFQSVAAGWTGRDAAFAGGASTALLGLVSHYGIACAMAFAYLLAAQRIPRLARQPFRYGPLYGIVLYFAMNFIVVPLSAAGFGIPAKFSWMEVSHLAAHMFLVGTTIAWFVHRATLHDARPATS